MFIEFDINEQRTKQFREIMDKVGDDPQVRKLLNMLLNESVDLFMSAFTTKDGKVNLEEATVLPSTYKQFINQREGKQNTLSNVLLIDTEELMNCPYYKVYDKQTQRVYCVPQEQVIRG